MSKGRLEALDYLDYKSDLEEGFHDDYEDEEMDGDEDDEMMKYRRYLPSPGWFKTTTRISSDCSLAKKIISPIYLTAKAKHLSF